MLPVGPEGGSSSYDTNTRKFTARLYNVHNKTDHKTDYKTDHQTDHRTNHTRCKGWGPWRTCGWPDDRKNNSNNERWKHKIKYR